MNPQQIIKSLLKCNEETKVIVNKYCYLQSTYDLFIQHFSVKNKLSVNSESLFVKLVQTRLIGGRRWNVNLIPVFFYYCNLYFFFCSCPPPPPVSQWYMTFCTFNFAVLFPFPPQLMSRVHLFLCIPLPDVSLFCID